MIVDITRGVVRGVEEVRPEILRFLQRHVATGAILHGLRRVVEAARAMSGHAAEQVRVIMVLAAEEILVVVQVAGNADLVAGRTKLRRAHERFQEGLLVKLRLALDQLLVEVLEKAVGAVGKRIMNRFVNRVVGVALGAVDVRDGVAGRAGDARL